MKPALVIFVGFVFTGCDRPSAPPSPAPVSPSASASTPVSATPAPVEAGVVDAGGASASTISVKFDDETVGGSPSSFEAVVGDWTIGQAASPPSNGLKVDGSRWRDGTPSANLADQAKRLYGDRYAEFLDGVKAFAFFPLAIYKDAPPAGDVRLSVRFHPLAGKIDQAAGIAFGIAPDGSYSGVRANALEDNILYFKVVKGKRTVLDTIRNVPTPTRTWHKLIVELRGKQLTVHLDDALRFEKTLDAVPVGRVGLWSKADSQVLFDDFEITKL
jgi:hypothetical protein